MASTARIEWEVSNSAAAWDEGWTLIIDGDSAGLFAPGTSITTGDESENQDVPQGSIASLSVNVHWESGGESASFATFSATITADCD